MEKLKKLFLMPQMQIVFGYNDLAQYWRKGVRTGTWRRMNLLEKALYRAAMVYTKHQHITNGVLVAKLLVLIEKLRETKGMRIFKRGFKRAGELIADCEENAVFVWAPSLRNWLKDWDYIFWLGTL